MPQSQEFTDKDRPEPTATTPTNNSITFQLQTQRVALVYTWGDRTPGSSSQEGRTRRPRCQTEVCFSSYKNIGNGGRSHMTTKRDAYSVHSHYNIQKALQHFFVTQRACALVSGFVDFFLGSQDKSHHEGGTPTTLWAVHKHPVSKWEMSIPNICTS